MPPSDLIQGLTHILESLFKLWYLEKRLVYPGEEHDLSPLSLVGGWDVFIDDVDDAIDVGCFRHPRKKVAETEKPILVAKRPARCPLGNLGPNGMK